MNEKPTTALRHQPTRKIPPQQPHSISKIYKNPFHINIITTLFAPSPSRKKSKSQTNSTTSPTNYKDASPKFFVNGHQSLIQSPESPRCGLFCFYCPSIPVLQPSLRPSTESLRLYRRQVIQPQRLRQQLIHLQDKGLEVGQRNVSL